MHAAFSWENLTESDHFGRPRLIWEDNIKMDFEEIGLEVVDWISMASGYG
jgi:hypothetical protein